MPLFAAAQYSEWLSQLPTVVDEFVGHRGIEFEHFEMTWDHQFRLNIPGELGCFSPEQVSRNAPFRRPPIDGKKCDIYVEGPQLL